MASDRTSQVQERPASLSVTVPPMPVSAGGAERTTERDMTDFSLRFARLPAFRRGLLAGVVIPAMLAGQPGFAQPAPAPEPERYGT